MKNNKQVVSYIGFIVAMLIKSACTQCLVNYLVRFVLRALFATRLSISGHSQRFAGCMSGALYTLDKIVP